MKRIRLLASIHVLRFRMHFAGKRSAIPEEGWIMMPREYYKASDGPAPPPLVSTDSLYVYRQEIVKPSCSRSTLTRFHVNL